MIPEKQVFVKYGLLPERIFCVVLDSVLTWFRTEKRLIMDIKAVNRKGSDCYKWDSVSEIYGEEDILPLWVADMDFRSPECVVEAIKARADHGVFGYSILPEDYFSAVTDWLKYRHGIDVRKEWIVPVQGVVPAVNMVIQEFTSEGDSVLVQQPVYYPFMSGTENNGRRVLSSDLVFMDGRYSIDFDDFEEKASRPETKLFILCSPHNPVGRVWTEQELEKMITICRKHGVTVLSDEIHSDLVWPGNVHHPSLSAAGAMDCTITCYAPSKTFNQPGLNAAYMVIPDEELRRAMKKRLEKNWISRLNVFGPVAQTAAYRGGREWLENVMEYIRGSMEMCMDFFKKELPQARPVKPEATYLLWVDMRDLCPAEELTDILRHKARVALDEGEMFGPAGAGFARINTGCSRELLLEALKRIKAAFTELI